MTARGGLLIWLVFLLPFLPDDAVCALAGLSGIGFGRFMLIATVGRIPAVAAGVFTMAGLEGAPAWVWGIAAAGFVLVLWAGARFGPTIERRLVGLSRAPRSDPEETGRVSKAIECSSRDRVRTSPSRAISCSPSRCELNRSSSAISSGGPAMRVEATGPTWIMSPSKVNVPVNRLTPTRPATRSPSNRTSRGASGSIGSPSISTTSQSPPRRCSIIVFKPTEALCR